MMLKRDVAEYVALCDTCQRVKAECQRPACRYLSGSRKRLVWTLLPDFHILNVDMIRFG